jgi:hypothetical protein
MLNLFQLHWKIYCQCLLELLMAKNSLGEFTHVYWQKSSFQVEVKKESGLYLCSVTFQSGKLPHVAGIAHKF